MRRFAFITIALLFSSNIFAQKIARSSIGCFGSSISGSFSVVSGSPVSSPILQNRNTTTGMSLQTRPFIHLRSNNTSTPIDITVYPNPSSDMVYIKTTADFKAIKVTDASGRLCFEGTKPQLSLGHLMPGVYTIKITLPQNGSYSQLLIIHR